jgi:RNA polymerase sigma-70 factor (ECF subfamily)
MNCDEATRLLDAYIDGELELTQHLDLEVHLAACTTCKKAAEAAMNFGSSIRVNMPVYNAPPKLKARIRARIAQRILRHDQDAQEAYIRAFKAFDHFRGGNSWAWFLTIVRNTAYNWYSKHTREPELIPHDEDKRADIVSINEQQYRLQTQDQTEDLRRMLERLPLELREVIILYELGGLSYRELATALEIPVGTVMSRLSRARRRLQEESGYGT